MNTALQDVARAMSTAIAPVFMITGVGAVLAAMSSRYGRVIDRARDVLREAALEPQDRSRRERVDIELRRLYQRAKVLRLTIILAATSIFCIAVTILVVFAALVFDMALSYVIIVLFTASLAFLTAALILFIEDFATSLAGLKYEIRSRLKRDPIAEGEVADAVALKGGLEE